MRFSAIALLLVSSIGWASPVDSVRSEQRDGKWFVIHQVDAGETLFAIARRYKSDVNSVIRENKIVDSSIQIGQMLSIPVEIKEQKAQATTSQQYIHLVQPGETLYAISRQYKVSVEDIKKWNNLTSESLNVDQQLAINSKAEIKAPKKDLPPFARAKKHYVQTGETLEKISMKRNVSSDSLMRWNKLRSDDLKIGQLLWFREYDRAGEDVKPKNYFGKVTQEGIAMQIEDMAEADKYLALHKTLPTGTLLEVRNLMNNKKVFVRVVGHLPDSGMYEIIFIRLTV
ncbi:MAG: LysM peptidoglycan-binding domain-containing protein [Cyclobacteriaceae bacterium]